MEKVFIIGVSRTASKTYQSAINNYSKIDIINEMHFITPFWLKRDFIRKAKEIIKQNQIKNQIKSIVEAMYRGEFEGAFWARTISDGKNYNINDIKKEHIIKSLKTKNLNFNNILEIILEEHAKAIGKKICGSKFPVNISKVPTLIKWFPDAKYLHITRDPRAVYPSMVEMDLRDIENTTINQKLKFNILRLIYLIHQYKWSNHIHNILKVKPNYFLSRFEDLILNPRLQLKRICEFLEVPFSEKMLVAEVKDTSFGKFEKKEGFNKKAIHRWKKTISPKTAKIIELLLIKEMKSLGYLG